MILSCSIHLRISLLRRFQTTYRRTARFKNDFHLDYNLELAEGEFFLPDSIRSFIVDGFDFEIFNSYRATFSVNSSVGISYWNPEYLRIRTFKTGRFKKNKDLKMCHYTMKLM